MWIFLIIIGILLIIINIKAVNKEKSNFKNILSEKEIDIKDYDLQIFNLKNELKMTKITLEKEIENLQIQLIDIKKYIKSQNEEKSKDKIKEENIKKDLEKSIKKDLEKNVKKDLKENVKKDLNKNIKKDLIEHKGLEGEKDNLQNLKNSNRNNVKVSEIQELLQKGLTIEEAAEKLNISKGEALLIKDLYLK